MQSKSQQLVEKAKNGFFDKLRPAAWAAGLFALL